MPMDSSGTAASCVPMVNGQLSTACVPVGTAGPGEACTGSDCSPGTFCLVDQNQAGVCVPPCFAPSLCPPGWTCSPPAEIQGRFVPLCLPA